MEQALDLNLDDAREMAAVGKALSSEVRIRMLRLLCRGPVSYTHLFPSSSLCAPRWRPQEEPEILLA